MYLKTNQIVVMVALLCSCGDGPCTPLSQATGNMHNYEQRHKSGSFSTTHRVARFDSRPTSGGSPTSMPEVVGSPRSLHVEVRTQTGG